MMNQVILPEEIYLLNIGIVFYLLYDLTKKYSSEIIITEQHFSNGQNLNFSSTRNLKIELKNRK